MATEATDIPPTRIGQAAAVSATRLWKHRAFRWLWTGQLLTALSDPLLLVALTFLLLHHPFGASRLGILLTVRTAGIALSAFPGSWLAGRFSQGAILRHAALARAAMLVVLLALPSAAIWPFAVLPIAVLGLVDGIFQPVLRALPAALVDEQFLRDVNALTSVSTRVVALGGPALAGALVVTVGARTALAVGAGLAAAAALAVGRMEAPQATPELPRSVGRGAIVAGFGALARCRWVAVETVAGCLQVAFALGPWLVLLPSVAVARWGGVSYGVLVSAMTVGGLVGSVATRHLGGRHVGVIACLALLPFSGALLALGLGAGLPVQVTLTVLAGAGVDIYAVLWITAVQREYEAVALNQVLTIDQLGSTALLPAGMLLASLGSRYLGNTAVLAIATLANGLTAAVPLILPDVRRFAAGASSEPRPGFLRENA